MSNTNRLRAAALKGKPLVSAAMIIAGTIFTTLLPGRPAQAAPLPLQDIAYDQARGAFVFQIQGVFAPIVKYFDRPNRIVMDLPEVLLSGPQRTIPVGRDGIVQVRVAQFQKEPAIVRVVFDVAPGSRLATTVRAGDSLPVALTNEGQDRYTISLSGFALEQDLTPVTGPGNGRVPPPPLVPQSRPVAAGPVQLSSLEFRAGEVLVTATQPLTPPSINMSNDGRLCTVTFPGLVAPQGLDELPVSSAQVRSVRVIATPGGTQLSLELSSPQGYSFRQEAGGRTIRLVPGARTLPGPQLPPPLPSNLVQVQSLTARNQDGHTDVIIRADKPLQYRISRLALPERVVVDIPQAALARGIEPTVTNADPLTQVRLNQATPDRVQITLDLTVFGQFESALSPDGRELRITLLNLAHAAPVGTPLVTIDPGHGGTDPGAIGPRGTTEAQVALAVSEELRKILAGIGDTVLLTRATDVEVLLQPRVDVANQNHANILVSVHCNSSSNPGAYGVETYYKWPPSLPLARAIHKKMVAELGTPDRGVRRANFFMVNHTTMPAVLVEIGYISNPAEETKLSSPEYRRAVAQAIADGIRDFFALPAK